MCLNILKKLKSFPFACGAQPALQGRRSVLMDAFVLVANFELPEEGQVFDKIEFVELDREEALKLVEVYNKDGKDHLPPDYYRQRYQSRYNDRDSRQRSYRPSGGKWYRKLSHG